MLRKTWRSEHWQRIENAKTKVTTTIQHQNRLRKKNWKPTSEMRKRWVVVELEMVELLMFESKSPLLLWWLFVSWAELRNGWVYGRARRFHVVWGLFTVLFMIWPWKAVEEYVAAVAEFGRSVWRCWCSVLLIKEEWTTTWWVFYLCERDNVREYIVVCRLKELCSWTVPTKVL